MIITIKTIIALMIYGYEQEFGRDIFEVLEYIRGKTPRENLPQSESILYMFFEQRKALEIVYYCLENLF